MPKSHNNTLTHLSSKTRRLVFYSILANLGLLLLFVTFIFISASRSMDINQSSKRDLTLLAEASVARTLESVELQLELLAERLKEAAEPNRALMIEAVRFSPHLRQLLLVENQQVILDSSGVSEKKALDLENLFPYTTQLDGQRFREVMQIGKVQASRFLPLHEQAPDPRSHLRTLPLRIKLSDDRYLIAALNIAYLEHRLTQQPGDTNKQHGKLAILHSNGQAVLNSVSPATAALIADAMDLDEHSAHGNLLYGSPYSHYHRRLSRYPLLIVQELYLPAQLALWLHSHIWLIFTVILILLSTLLISIRLTFAIAREREQSEMIHLLQVGAEQMLEGLLVINQELFPIYANHAALHLLGQKALADMKNTKLTTLLEMSETNRRALQTALSNQVPWRSEVKRRSPIHGRMDLECSTTPIDSIDKNQHLTLILLRDLSEEKAAQDKLKLAATVFNTAEGIFITDHKQQILQVNQAFCEITGYDSEEVIGHTPGILSSGKHGKDFYDKMKQSLNQHSNWRGEIWNRRKNGDVYPEWLTITAVYDDAHQLTHYVAVLTDISLRKAYEEQIHQLAFYDPLTSLPNRRLIFDRLRHAMALNQREHLIGALLFIDLDRFKILNDTHGHAMGDQLLQQVADRIQTVVRTSDTLARLGGDEFVVILERLGNNPGEAAHESATVADKILSALSQPFTLTPLVSHHCSGSIGIALFGTQDMDAEEILKRGDIAMYAAKAKGRGTAAFFEQPG